MQNAAKAFRAASLALLAALLAVLAGPPEARAHNDGAYWHTDGPAANHPQWMLTISPTKRLTELSLPGTHDSGTYRGFGGDSFQTQTMTIREQLNSGIRSLDIRLKYYDGTALRNCNGDYSSPDCKLQVFHGIGAQGVYFEPDVLQPVISFLRDNPSEFVIMRIAKETAKCDCSPGPALRALLDASAEFGGRGAGEKYADYMLPQTCPDPVDLVLGPVRPLGTKPDKASCDLRGKVLLVQDFFDNRYGAALAPRQYYRWQGYMPWVDVEYGENCCLMPDYYFKLWLPVKNRLAAAAADSDPSELLFASLAGSGGGFPYFFASGHSNPATGAPRLSTGLVQGISATAETLPDFPRTNCVGSLCTISYEGMNTLVANYLLRPEFRIQERRVGVIMTDFPGDRLIRTIASINRGTVFDRPSFNYEMIRADGRRYAPGSWTNRPVTLTPRCSFPPCTGTPAAVNDDAPTGIIYTMTSGGRTVQIPTTPVRIDTVPPTIRAAPLTSPNESGWYTDNVSIRFTCDDGGGSGLASCPRDRVLRQQGIVVSEPLFAADNAGNRSAPSNSVTVRIDKSRPRVAYTGNVGTYMLGQEVSITCSADDQHSGIASSTCADIRGPASQFGVGVHRFSATATDVAGNTGSGSTSFRVVAPPAVVNPDGALRKGD